MRRFTKWAVSVMTAVIMIAAAAISVSAADFEIEMPEKHSTKGSWGQAIQYRTPNTGEPALADNFDPQWMTKDSEVHIEYTYEGETSARPYPAELIWQTWEIDGEDIPAAVNGTWNKVEPYEFDDTHAKFKYDDIVEAYGTPDFSSVMCICIGDTGVKLDLQKMVITNCDIPEDKLPESETETETETETEKVTEKATEKETEKPSEAAETAENDEPEETTFATDSESIAQNAPKDSNAAVVVIVAIVIILIIGGGAAAIFLITKKSKGKFY